METEQIFLTSNYAKIEEYIEQNVEKKINQLMDVLPRHEDVNTPKMIYEYTISELYNGTLQTIIDIINEVTELISERKYISSKIYRERMFEIFIKKTLLSKSNLESIKYTLSQHFSYFLIDSVNSEP